jgi:hypothetical protein
MDTRFALTETKKGKRKDRKNDIDEWTLLASKIGDEKLKEAKDTAAIAMQDNLRSLHNHIETTNWMFSS